MRLHWAVGALLFAGCMAVEPTSDSNTGSSDEESQTAEPNGPKVTNVDGVVGASAGAGGNSVGAAGTPGDFIVNGTATLLYAELAWDDPVTDLDLALRSPTGAAGPGGTYDHTVQGGQAGSPDSPHSFTLSGPEEGTWSATVFANGASAQTEYRLRVTVFHGETTVPDGYSAMS